MDRPLIIETDIGRDPNDLFALCYLFGAGADIRAITIWPGDPDQVAVVRFLLRQLGRDDIPWASPTQRATGVRLRAYTRCSSK